MGTQNKKLKIYNDEILVDNIKLKNLSFEKYLEIITLKDKISELKNINNKFSNINKKL